MNTKIPVIWRSEGLIRGRYVGSGGRYGSAAASEEPRIRDNFLCGVEIRISQIRCLGGPAERGIASPGPNHIVSGSIPERKTKHWDIVLSVFLLDARSLGASICAEMVAQPPKCCSRSLLNGMRPSSTRCGQDRQYARRIKGWRSISQHIVDPQIRICIRKPICYRFFQRPTPIAKVKIYFAKDCFL